MHFIAASLLANLMTLCVFYPASLGFARVFFLVVLFNAIACFFFLSLKISVCVFQGLQGLFCHRRNSWEYPIYHVVTLYLWMSYCIFSHVMCNIIQTIYFSFLSTFQVSQIQNWNATKKSKIVKVEWFQVIKSLPNSLPLCNSS